MAVRSVLACVSLIALAVTNQPAFAANDDNPPPANAPGASPSANPAKRPHRHHHFHRHRHRQQQTPSPQDGGAPSDNG